MQNFKLFVRAKADHDKEKGKATSMDDLPAQIKSTYNKIVEQLATIDQVRLQTHLYYVCPFCKGYIIIIIIIMMKFALENAGDEVAVFWI